ncbi:MAG: SPOR domain-containing protein [Magnetococcales bacterium]|nr:SPOR domain-containing protein [Magnetococcales bacterium]
MAPGIAATLFFACMLMLPWLALGGIGDQGAFITNAYFSDKLVEVGEVLRPSSVVSVLPSNVSGVNGYFIMDVAFVELGTHQLQIDILDRNSKKIADIAYDPVKVQDKDHIYTVVGSVAGEFPSGWLFFKVFDQVNRKERQHLSTFYIMTRDPVQAERKPEQEKARRHASSPAPARSSPLGDFQFSPDSLAEEESPPTRSRPAATTASPPQSPATHEPAEASSPTPSAPVPAVSQGSGFSIYLGSYGSSGNAEHVTSRVNSLGIPSFYKIITVDDKHYYRVNAGSFAKASEAELAARLIEEKTGIKGSVHDLTQAIADARPAPESKTGARNEEKPSSPKADLIYVGSYPDRKAARENYQKLEKLDLPVFHQQTQIGPQPFTRLFVGPLPDPKKMTAALNAIQDKLGIKGTPMSSRQGISVPGPQAVSPARDSTSPASPAHQPEERHTNTHPETPTRKPEPTPPQETPSSQEKKRIAVKMQAYANKNRADQKQQELERSGLPVFQKETMIDGHRRHQIYLGPFQNRAAAKEAVRIAARQTGHGGTILPVKDPDKSNPAPVPGQPQAKSDPDPTTNMTREAAPLTIQVVSYFDQEMAEQMKTKLLSWGVPAFIQNQEIRDRHVLTVMAGPFSSQKAGEEAQRWIAKKSGIQGMLQQQTLPSAHPPQIWPAPHSQKGMAGKEESSPATSEEAPPPSVPTPSADSPSDETKYLVYLGAFGKKNRVDSLQKRLLEFGLPVIKQNVPVSQGHVDALCSGPFPSRREAEVATKLISEQMELAKVSILETAATKINTGKGCRPGF